MNNAKIHFNQNIESIRNINAIYAYLKTKAIELDADYLLRSEFVLIVSAFDTYIHELVIDMLVDRFFNSNISDDIGVQIPISIAQSIVNATSDFEKQQTLLSELRRIMASYSFQSPKSIEFALSLLGLKKIWRSLSQVLSKNADDIRNTLSLIINRRNKIAHESDFDQITSTFTSIDKKTVDDCANFIIEIVNGIEKII